MNKHTYEMLDRLRQTLRDNLRGWKPDSDIAHLQSKSDAQSLRRIAMTLHRWHELECGAENGFASFCLVRGKKDVGGAFEYDDGGRAYMEVHAHYRNGATYRLVPDRETGARKRLAKIMASYPALLAYIQTDPRGASLYILRRDDIPAGASVDFCYSRGIAVYK